MINNDICWINAQKLFMVFLGTSCEADVREEQQWNTTTDEVQVLYLGAIMWYLNQKNIGVFTSVHLSGNIICGYIFQYEASKTLYLGMLPCLHDTFYWHSEWIEWSIFLGSISTLSWVTDLMSPATAGLLWVLKPHFDNQRFAEWIGLGDPHHREYSLCTVLCVSSGSLIECMWVCVIVCECVVVGKGGGGWLLGWMSMWENFQTERERERGWFFLHLTGQGSREVKWKTAEGDRLTSPLGGLRACGRFTRRGGGEGRSRWDGEDQETVRDIHRCVMCFTVHAGTCEKWIRVVWEWHEVAPLWNKTQNAALRWQRF